MIARIVFGVAALLFCAVVVVQTGCVNPETAEKIESLEDRIEEIAVAHADGTLTTEEAVGQIKPLLAEMKAVKDAEGKWYDKLFFGVGLAIPWLLRGLGVPLFRSGSGGNWLKSLLGKTS